MAEILPMRRKTLPNQSINQSTITLDLCQDRERLTGKIRNIHRFLSVTVKTFFDTMQWAETNLLQTSSKTLEWHYIFNSFSFSLVVWDYQFNSVYQFVVIEPNVLHRLVAYLESLSYKNIP